jgi:hypothetical protein
LHRATTTSLRLDNRQFVYLSSHRDDALLVALNIADSPLSFTTAKLGFDTARVLGGAGMPPEGDVRDVIVQPQGWLILRPA